MFLLVYNHCENRHQLIFGQRGQQADEPILTVANWYWSSTTFANDSNRAWGFNVGETPLGGGVVLNDDKGSLTDFARAVRP
jgi:hypothetical protein